VDREHAERRAAQTGHHERRQVESGGAAHQEKVSNESHSVSLSALSALKIKRAPPRNSTQTKTLGKNRSLARRMTIGSKLKSVSTHF